MRRFSCPFVLTALVLASVVGCQPKPPIQQKVPGDPLLSSKKPLESRSSTDPTREAATLYPMAPPAPIDDPESAIRRVSILPERIENEGPAQAVRLGQPQFTDR